MKGINLELIELKSYVERKFEFLIHNLSSSVSALSTVKSAFPPKKTNSKILQPDIGIIHREKSNKCIMILSAVKLELLHKFNIAITQVTNIINVNTQNEQQIDKNSFKKINMKSHSISRGKQQVKKDSLLRDSKKIVEYPKCNALSQVKSKIVAASELQITSNTNDSCNYPSNDKSNNTLGIILNSLKQNICESPRKQTETSKVLECSQKSTIITNATIKMFEEPSLKDKVISIIGSKSFEDFISGNSLDADMNRIAKLIDELHGNNKELGEAAASFIDSKRQSNQLFGIRKKIKSRCSSTDN